MANENKYFTRKINEGTIKRTHICSFDSSIELKIIITNGKSVIDYLLNQQAQAAISGEKKEISKKAFEAAKENLITDLASLRINDLPILYEDLPDCFDSEEILEVMAFVNGQDMSVFKGEKVASEKN